MHYTSYLDAVINYYKVKKSLCIFAIVSDINRIKAFCDSTVYDVYRRNMVLILRE